MLENPFCHQCDSQNLESLDISEFDKQHPWIEVERLRCNDCGFVTSIPLRNSNVVIKESIKSLSSDTSEQKSEI